VIARDNEEKSDQKKEDGTLLFGTRKANLNFFGSKL
jgi:hypothetical protein